MITEYEYASALEYLIRTDPDIKAWYTTYQSRLHFYRVNGRIVRSFELWAYIFEDDISKLELPKGMPQEIHDKAMEALADTDIEAVLLKIKLGV